MGAENQSMPEDELKDELFIQPEWVNPDSIEPAFTEKATPADGMTDEQFKAKVQQKKEIKEMVSKFGTPEGEAHFTKLVKGYKTEVPESFMTDKERDKKFGAHPRTKHEMEKLDRPN